MSDERNSRFIVLTQDPRQRAVVGDLVQLTLQNSSSSCFVFADSHVLSIHGTYLEKWLKTQCESFHIFPLPQGEACKTLQVAEEAWTWLLERGAQRDSLVIGFGGGATTDLTAFLASTFMRGLSLALIPTTLLAMIDAAIGGKTGINFGGFKNNIGSFYPAQELLLCPEFCQSLPRNELTSAMAEVIKYACIGADDLFPLLDECLPLAFPPPDSVLKRLIALSVKQKQDIVAEDPLDEGFRMTLNFGHSFGHAIESCLGPGGIPHGFAVAIGMVCASHFAEESGFCNEKTRERICGLIERAGLPTRIPAECNPRNLVSSMLKDKKNSEGGCTLILPRRFGKVEIVPGFAAEKIESFLVGMQKRQEQWN